MFVYIVYTRWYTDKCTDFKNDLKQLTDQVYGKNQTKSGDKRKGCAKFSIPRNKFVVLCGRIVLLYNCAHYYTCDYGLRLFCMCVSM